MLTIKAILPFYYMYRGGEQPPCSCGSLRTFCWTVSLLPPCEAQRLNPGSKAWQQILVPTSPVFASSSLSCVQLWNSHIHVQVCLLRCIISHWFRRLQYTQYFLHLTLLLCLTAFKRNTSIQIAFSFYNYVTFTCITIQLHLIFCCYIYKQWSSVCLLSLSLHVVASLYSEKNYKKVILIYAYVIYNIFTNFSFSSPTELIFCVLCRKLSIFYRYQG